MKKTVFLIIIVSLLFAFVGCDGELKDQHVWDEGTITKHATCTQEGVKTFTCSHCNATKTEPVVALGHDFTTKVADEKYVASQPTAEKAAEYYYICSRCGEKGTETFTHGQPHVHEWGDGEVQKKATCAETGVSFYKCSVCQATKTDVVAKDASNHVGYEYVAADKLKFFSSTIAKEKCIGCGDETGKTKDMSKSVDGYWVSDSASVEIEGRAYEISMNILVFGSNSVAETMTDGVVQFMIEGGFDVETDDSDDKVVQYIVLEDTYEVDGKNETYKIYYPIVSEGDECFTLKIPVYDDKTVDMVFRRVDKEKHSHTFEGDYEFLISSDASYTGHYRKMTCKEHDAFKFLEEHTYGEDEKCSVCGCDMYYTIILDEEVSEGSHRGYYRYATKDVGYVLLSPMCEAYNAWMDPATGKVYNPGDTVNPTEEMTLVAVLLKSDCEHSWDSGIVMKTATCVETGVRKYTCSKCGGTKTETIPMDSENHGETDIVFESDNLKFFTPTKGERKCVECGAVLDDGLEAYKPLEGFWISESFSVGETGEGEVYFSFEAFNGSEMASVTIDFVSVNDVETQGQPIYALYERICDGSSAFLKIENLEGDDVYIRVLEDDVDANGNGFVVIDAYDFIGVKTLKLIKVSEKAHSHRYKEGVVGEPNDYCHFLATDCGESHRAISKMRFQHVYEGEADSCSVCGCYRYYKITFLNEDGSIYHVENVEKGADYFLPVRDDIEGGWKVEGEDYVRDSGSQFYFEKDTTFVFVPCNGEHSYGYSYNDYEFEYFVPYEIEEKCSKCGLKSGNSETVYRHLYGLWTTPEVEISREGQTAKVMEFLSFDALDGSSEMVMDGDIVLTISGRYTIEEPIDPKYIARLVITDGSMTSAYEIISVSGSDYGSDRFVQFKAYEGGGIDLEMTFSLCSDTWGMHYHDWNVVSFDSEGHLKETSCEEHAAIRLKEPHSLVDSKCTVCEYSAILE